MRFTTAKYEALFERLQPIGYHRATMFPGPLTVSWPVKMASGNALIVASGAVTTFLGNPLEIFLLDLKLVFEFLSNKDILQHELRAETPDAHTVKLVLTNFDSPLGTGSSAPLEFGHATVNNQPGKLFLHFQVHRLGDSPDRTVHFCVYHQREVAPSA